MDIAGEYTFDAPRDLVWEAMRDPDVLGSVMPGGEGFEEIGENEYAGKLKIKVGPVQGVFMGNIKLSDLTPPESYTIIVDGKGAPGFVKAEGHIKLDSLGDTQTHLDYSGSAQIGGRIASVGQRLMDSAARSIIRQSLDGLNEYLKVQAAEQAPASAPPAETPTAAESPDAPGTPAPPEPAKTAPPAPAYKPPSQFRIGLTVMRDVLNDLVPPRYQPVLAIAVVAIIVIIILLAR